MADPELTAIQVELHVPLGEPQPVLLKNLGGEENTLAYAAGSCALLSAEEPDAQEPAQMVVEIALSDRQGALIGHLLLPPHAARALAGQLLCAVHSIVSLDPGTDPETIVETIDVPRGEA